MSSIYLEPEFFTKASDGSVEQFRAWWQEPGLIELRIGGVKFIASPDTLERLAKALAAAAIENRRGPQLDNHNE